VWNVGQALTSTATHRVSFYLASKFLHIKGARIAQLIKSLDLRSINHKFGPHYHLGMDLKQIASVDSDHHGKKRRSQPVDNEGEEHSLVVKDAPLLSQEK